MNKTRMIQASFGDGTVLYKPQLEVDNEWLDLCDFCSREGATRKIDQFIEWLTKPIEDEMKITYSIVDYP